ncbi:hypothetical protein [Bifidobacterium aesculapii]|uniref:hypothetical protein n=1 Tax=Bifidobacterium aesculapii TaxID=1329411 RepID=UPI0006E3CF87|nr:hypothetical protein [Bifidobacterium aesculapii]
MALRSSNTAARLIAMAAGFAMLASCAACGGQDAASGTTAAPGGNTAAGTTASAGSAVIFTPSDGITISQSTPLNKWAKLVPEITDGLVANGMAKKSIETKTSSDLDDQSRDVQDWVVDHMAAEGQSDSQNDEKRTTLIVAPAVPAGAATRQYGDYVTQPQDDDDTAEGTDDGTDAYTRLASALSLAQDSGMHVILLANGVDGVTPDAFARFSTAEQIGRIEAQKLVTKLDLAKASKDNPKAIEVLIPYTATASNDSDDNDSDEEVASPARDDAFSREAFAGMWKVLQPYFTQGKAYSPSGTLSKTTTDDDWRDVAVDGSDRKTIAAEVDRRLPTRKTSDGTAHMRVDGVIAMNDYVASVVTEELGALGYTGSAADVNPQITISGIVDNITGKKDLQRGSVPDPAKAPETADDAQDDAAAVSGVDEINSRWPIVTGFGAYVDTMPQIVNGKQWMTGLENRMALASDIAEVTVRLNRGESLTKLSYITKAKVDGAAKRTNVIEEEPLAVSASNLKAALIDPGYITMADAGL